MFVSNLGLGPVFFYPFVVTLVGVMAWFAYDEVGDAPVGALESEE
jgi:hypothetical protein